MTRTAFHATALRSLGLAACALLNLSGTAMAADALPSRMDSALHAAALFGLVWLIASLRVGRVDGGWRFGFDLLPVWRQTEMPAVPTSRS